MVATRQPANDSDVVDAEFTTPDADYADADYADDLAVAERIYGPIRPRRG